MVITAEATTGGLASNYNANDQFEDGTLLADYRDQFKYGRTTAETCEDAVGLMPNPENGCDGLQSIFVDNIYASVSESRAWRFTAAISGAHTIGSAKLENSGYEGLWGDPENQNIFNNDYFKNIVSLGWGPDLAVNGNTAKNQWKLVDLSSSEDKAEQMMLDTDMCLFYADQNRDDAYLSATETDCCAWTSFGML